jgi:calcineurin-like phosphoesterase family protein
MDYKFRSEDVAFISDTHFGHANIIKYCNRPFEFPDTSVMDKLMWDNMLLHDAIGRHIIHLGDMMFYSSKAKVPKFRYPEKHILLLGNHDKPEPIQNIYPKIFGTILGHPKNWKVFSHTIYVDDIPILLSHEPQRYLGDCKYNIYGHHHNNMFKNPDYFIEEYDWLFDSEKHINVGVELIDYNPISFQDALKLPKPQKPA